MPDLQKTCSKRGPDVPMVQNPSNLEMSWLELVLTPLSYVLESRR